jgi:hypothetical protein
LLQFYAILTLSTQHFLACLARIIFGVLLAQKTGFLAKPVFITRCATIYSGQTPPLIQDANNHLGLHLRRISVPAKELGTLENLHTT